MYVGRFNLLIRTYTAVCQSFVNNANRRDKFYWTLECDRDMILRLRQLSVLWIYIPGYIHGHLASVGISCVVVIICETIKTPEAIVADFIAPERSYGYRDELLERGRSLDCREIMNVSRNKFGANIFFCGQKNYQSNYYLDEIEKIEKIDPFVGQYCGTRNWKIGIKSVYNTDLY